MKYGFKDIVIDSRTGLNPRKNFVLGNGKNNYITIKDIYNGQINITDKTDKVDDEAIQIIKKRSRIKVGDILFVSIGRIGETAIVEAKDDTWDVNESVFVFTLNREIITPEYFCTLFQSDAVQKYLAGNSSGSTFKSIKMNQLERMEFDLPPLKIQESITTKLSKVKAICTKRSAELTYLDDLIKARFVEMSSKWERETRRAPLYEYIKYITYGFTNPMPDADIGPWKVTAKDITNGVVNYATARRTTQESYDLLTEKCKPVKGDVLLTKDGTLGRLAVVDQDGICVNQSVAVLRPNEKILPSFLMALLNSPTCQSEMIVNSGGGTIKHLYITKVDKMEVVVPKLDEQEKFISFMCQINKSKSVIQKSLDETKLLFDSLMQKYFG